MMLALRPDLCDQEAMNTVVCPPNEEGMMDVRGVYRWQAFADYTPTGAQLPLRPPVLGACLPCVLFWRELGLRGQEDCQRGHKTRMSALEKWPFCEPSGKRPFLKWQQQLLNAS